MLSVGFGGQELGEAVVDMLVGDLEPGGRAPTTIGARYEHFAAYLNYPGENSVTRYGEGVFCGHRWHDAMTIEPAVAFGEGLGYSTFEFGAPEIPDSIDAGEGLVEQNEARLRGQGTRDFHAPAFTAGQRVNLGPRLLGSE